VTSLNPEDPRSEPRGGTSEAAADATRSERRAERRTERDARRDLARRRRLERTFAVARGAERAARVTARGVARAPVVVVVTPARALRDIARYWRAERVTLRQGFAALSISSAGDLLTGVALGAMTGRLEALPSLLILVPPAIGMRGAIFGALGSRLGTSIHAGLFKFSRDRRGILYQNGYAAMLLSVMSAAYLAVVARFVATIVGLPAISVWDFMAISVLAGVGSSAVILVLTILLARLASEREWDMDAVAAPVITFMGDIVTMPALFGASYAAAHGSVTLGAGIVLAALGVWALVTALRTDLPAARRILRESVLMLALAGIVNAIAGVVIEHRSEHFFALPALLVLIPPFLEDAGALGGIVSARLASKLHLGAIRPRAIPERLAWLDISLAAPFALSVFTLVGLSSHFVARAIGKPSPGLGLMVGIALVAGYLATLGAAVISYAAAVATFRFGLDPDNHGIAIVTSTMDLVGMLALVAAIAMFGVG
jgi:mgtE-like transporter